jgi:ribose 5-phosphate isomerase RpiB
VETAVSCATAFLAATFSGAPRHVRRVGKIRAIEQEAARLEAAERTR